MEALAPAARPYCLFGERERESLSAGAEARVRAWAADWLPEGTPARARSVPAPARATRLVGATGWERFDAGAEGWLAVPDAERVREALAAAICGAERPAGRSKIALEAASAALCALATAILGAAASRSQRGREAEPVPEVWAAGSPALSLRMDLGEPALAVEAIASPEWALRALGRRAGKNAGARAVERLAERRQAIGAQNVELRVLAGSLEIDLRTLRTLEVGNVITLETRIGEPMAVVVAAGGRPAARAARLGSLDGHKAIAIGARAGKEGK